MPNKSLNEFKNNILKSWKEIKQEHINNAIGSVPKRIKNVIKNGGKSINY